MQRFSLHIPHPSQRHLQTMPQDVVDDDGKPIYCFVYGATSNPISRSRRKISTKSAQPAVLQDYRIIFGQGGAATILPKRGWTVHGVLLECDTIHDLHLLQEIGATFELTQLPVHPYESEEEEAVEAHVFCMAGESLETDELPQERYIQIIAEGLKYHGVEQEYIDYQIMNANYIPYPKVLLEFENDNKSRPLRDIAYSTYLSRRTRNLWFLIGRKVIEIQPAKHQKKDVFVEWAKRELVAKPTDSTWFMLQLMYDPALPVCMTAEEIQPEHVQWAEHQLVEKFQESHVAAVTVGLVDDTTPNKRRSLLRGLSRRAFSHG